MFVHKQAEPFLIRNLHLHTAGVEHHTDGLSHGLRRQVVAEEHTHDSVGSVSLGDLSPDAAVARTVLHGLGLHTVRTLSKQLPNENPLSTTLTLYT